MESLIHSSPPLDCVAFAAHPDDAELGVGGTLALLARRGWRVGIVGLTRGEAGTRGTPEIRAAEAREAATTLGLAHQELLDLGDCDLANSEEHRVALVAAIRRLRPRVIITNGPDDRHPDHRRAQELVRDASFLANVGGYHPEAGARWLTQALCFFPQHQHVADPRADWIVDVGETFEIKMEALRAYRSQLYVAPPEDAPLVPDDPAKATYIASPEFWQFIQNRSFTWGHRIGAHHGEPLLFDRPAHANHPLVRMLNAEGGSRNQ